MVDTAVVSFSHRIARSVIGSPVRSSVARSLVRSSVVGRSFARSVVESLDVPTYIYARSEDTV
ncbi:hypothetical protein C496_15097 [Natronorubrum tibetense GA33]|uniref:Uncharacterized protein n=1 Tax=Natronorubrum tibetense GA33 TaxID=1114856 RepID=L9VPQ5_9EURY|nr:hypothetical protein C496_15097 [Natronorubrum tibetense GA33]